LAFLSWHLDTVKLEKVLADLVALFPVVQWSIQEVILNFVHSVCFAQMFVLEKRILRKVFDEFLTLFMEHERGELREGAVRFVRMLLPNIWDDFGEFFRNEVDERRRPLVATANAVALVGAVIVVTEPPVWMPQLLAFLTAAHRKVRTYAELIDRECAAFWKRIGSRRIPAIDEFRITFGGGYFA
jgi:hypothetical protein